MKSATAAFISAGDEEELAGSTGRPPSSAIAMPAETTMNSAFRMLFAAMIRERCDGAERSWISA